MLMSSYPLALFRMARPAQLLLIAVVYAYGVAIAHATGSDLEWGVIFAGLAGLFLVSTSVHLANEYADHETDKLTRRTLFSGGSGVLSTTNIPRKHALTGAWIALTAGYLIALGASLARTLPTTSLVVLIIGGFFGWMYSLKPLALAWRGWGELANSILGGLLLPLYGYTVLDGSVHWFPVLMSLPFFGLAFINLLATTWPDRDADAQVRKLTLATRWDPWRLRALYWVMATASSALLVVYAVWISEPIYALSFGVLPLVVWGGLTYTRAEDPFPTVAAMVCLVVLQLAVWIYLGLG